MSSVWKNESFSCLPGYTHTNASKMLTTATSTLPRRWVTRTWVSSLGTFPSQGNTRVLLCTASFYHNTIFTEDEEVRTWKPWAHFFSCWIKTWWQNSRILKNSVKTQVLGKCEKIQKTCWFSKMEITRKKKCEFFCQLSSCLSPHTKQHSFQEQFGPFYHSFLPRGRKLFSFTHSLTH